MSDYWLNEMREQQRGRVQNLVDEVGGALGPAGVFVVLPALAIWFAVRTIYKTVFPPKKEDRNDA